MLLNDNLLRVAPIIRQIFIVHQSIWDAMQLWADVHGFHLGRLPTGTTDPTPTYAFMPRLPGDR